MKTLLIALALALASPASAAAPTAQHAAGPAATLGHGWVYLGRLGADGRISFATLNGAPSSMKASVEGTTTRKLDKPLKVQTMEGLRLRGSPSPTAEALGRIPRGATVRMVGLYANYGFVWAELDTSGARVITARLMSPAVDGFTGRSGYGPSTASTTRTTSRRG